MHPAQELKLAQAALHKMTEQLKYIQANYPAVIARLKQAQGNQYPGTSGATRTIGNNESTVERAALNEHHDPIPHDIRTLHRLLQTTADNIHWLHQRLTTYDRPTTQPPTCQCRKCGATCTRLRREMCGACYKRWERAGRPLIASIAP